MEAVTAIVNVVGGFAVGLLVGYVATRLMLFILYVITRDSSTDD